jgi:hypothetical protein
VAQQRVFAGTGSFVLLKIFSPVPVSPRNPAKSLDALDDLGFEQEKDGRNAQTPQSPMIVRLGSRLRHQLPLALDAGSCGRFADAFIPGCVPDVGLTVAVA